MEDSNISEINPMQGDSSLDIEIDMSPIHPCLKARQADCSRCGKNKR